MNKYTINIAKREIIFRSGKSEIVKNREGRKEEMQRQITVNINKLNEVLENPF